MARSPGGDMIQAIFMKRHPPVGSRPGTLVIREESPPPKIRVMRYGPKTLEEVDLTGPAEIAGFMPESGGEGAPVTWVDVQGLGSEAVLREVGDLFGIHPLALEDVVNVPQRPKAEAYDRYMLLVTRMARIFPDRSLDMEQVGLIVGEGYVVSFQEKYGDVLDPVRERIRIGKGPIRQSPPDYLAYAILDTIVDAYYPVIETLSSRIEQLGDAVMHRPTPAVLEALYRVKADLLLIRRGIWPQREALNRVIRDPEDFQFSSEVRVYLRDSYDHCAQLVDVVDSHREIISGALNMYLSVVANRTNEVMKVLTIMASIFIPLTFMAGIYGMNFENMPELGRPWAYPLLLGAMLGTAGGMLAYFWKKGWIGRGDSGGDDEI
jgi:magnesium transporter